MGYKLWKKVIAYILITSIILTSISLQTIEKKLYAKEVSSSEMLEDIKEAIILVAADEAEDAQDALLDSADINSRAQ